MRAGHKLYTRRVPPRPSFRDSRRCCLVLDPMGIAGLPTCHGCPEAMKILKLDERNATHDGSDIGRRLSRVSDETSQNNAGRGTPW